MEVAGVSRVLLQSFADKSWLRQSDDGRYVLHDLVRQYAAEKCRRSDELEGDARARHCVYFAAFLAERTKLLHGQDQRHALDDIGLHLDDAVTAWQYAVATGRLVELRAALESLYLFFDMRGRFREGAGLFAHAAQDANGHGDEWDIERARFSSRQAALLQRAALYNQARERLQACLAVFRTHNLAAEIAFALYWLGDTLRNLGESADARPMLEESLGLYRQLGDDRGAALALYGLGYVAQLQGEHEEARRVCRESVALFRRVGDRAGLAGATRYLGIVHRNIGDTDTAMSLFRESLRVSEEIGDRNGMAYALNNIGSIHWALGEAEAAEDYVGRSVALGRETGNLRALAFSLADLGNAALRGGRLDQSRRLLEEGLDIFEEIGERWGSAITLSLLGNTAAARGAYPQARRSYRRSLETAIEIGAMPSALETLADMASYMREILPPETLVEMLSLPLRDPSHELETQERAAHMIAELSTTLPAQVVAAALDRGQQRPIMDWVESLG
jgi:tetratricopeptide (TPR) repeat protein